MLLCFSRFNTTNSTLSVHHMTQRLQRRFAHSHTAASSSKNKSIMCFTWTILTLTSHWTVKQSLSQWMKWSDLFVLMMCSSSSVSLVLGMATNNQLPVFWTSWLQFPVQYDFSVSSLVWSLTSLSMSSEFAYFQFQRGSCVSFQRCADETF